MAAERGVFSISMVSRSCFSNLFSPDYQVLFSNVIQILTFIFIFSKFFLHLTAIEEISFYSAVLLIIFSTGLKKTYFSLRTPLTLPFFLFLLWSLFTLPFALNISNSIHDIYAHLIKYYIFFFIVFNFFTQKKDLVRISWTFSIFSALFCAGGILYFYFFMDRPITERFFLVRDAFIPYLGYLLELAVFFCALIIYNSRDRSVRIFFSLCFFIISAAIILTQSRSALLVVVTGSVIIFFRYKKLYFLLLVFILIPFTPLKERLTNVQSIVNNERISNFHLYAEIVKDHPFTGIGFGMQTHQKKGFLEHYFSRLAPEQKKYDIIGTPHSLFLDITVRTGLLGLLIFLYIVWRIAASTLKLTKSSDPFVKEWGLFMIAAFTGFFLQSLFEEASFGRAAIVFYLICAILAILLNIKKKSGIEANALASEPLK